MEHLKEGLRNDIEKLTSSTHRILSGTEGMNSIDIDILLESTRRFYERAVELRDVFLLKKKMLSDSDEVITMPFISGEEYREEVKVREKIEELLEIIEDDTDIKEIAKEIIKEELVPVEENVEETIDEAVQPTMYAEEGMVQEDVVNDEIVVEQVPEENIVVTEEEPIPFEVNQITMDNRPQEEPQIEEIPIMEEEVVTEEKKSRPELFDYLNTSNIGVKTAGAKQSDLFGMESNASTTVGERFQQTHTRSILDQLSSSANNSNVAGRTNQTVIEDIRQVIGINEKFLFINELFGGNMREYNDFILTLNDIQSTDEALQYLGSVRERKGWDTQSLAYVSFLKIFERKFI